MSEMDDWMRQDKSMNSNLQQSNRRSPSTCIKWHLERKEYLRNYYFFIIFNFFISKPFLWVLCKDKNRGSALSSPVVQDHAGFSWAFCIRFGYIRTDF